MVIRTYIDKNNTIVKNTETNTGRNEIAELYYGGNPTKTQYSRHLLYFDVTESMSASTKPISFSSFINF